jgi:hypothetical protein
MQHQRRNGTVDTAAHRHQNLSFPAHTSKVYQGANVRQNLELRRTCFTTVLLVPMSFVGERRQSSFLAPPRSYPSFLGYASPGYLQRRPKVRPPIPQPRLPRSRVGKIRKTSLPALF